MSMEYLTAIKLIKKAREQIVEDKIYARWIANHDSTISFDEFKNRLIHKSENNNKTGDEILDEVAEMMKLYKFE